MAGRVVLTVWFRRHGRGRVVAVSIHQMGGTVALL